MTRALPALLLTLALLMATRARAEPTAAPAPAKKHPGCFVLMDLKTGELKRNDAELCAKRLPPASTFKVPHALIALETGVVTDPAAPRKWDGKKRDIAEWNRDHSLESAIRYSALWFFQGTAKQIGRERMKDWVHRFGYGNEDTSGELTSFWLGGPLRISPEEQVRFLARLYRGELPVSERSRETVKRILVQSPDTAPERMKRLAGPWPSGAVVSGKTGTTHTKEDGDVSWLVGHVRSPGGEYVFASLVTGEHLEGPIALHAAVDELQALGML
ncbi:penicillin-binding transpeptidase domain-containing protein [Vitiosangium sp. GDMCC 1.1324]|uniref:penicillin-binding transpeptidase domain-containing protein n=1 Tax=Vitiosangium sp. (strain GDMCC 1.1324) TaxID=2138576 RepID=UPI00130E01C9|nr:penicillin-binding transpeptidase domain-containing protein [Vitiosangium sp. GDMCC 1.1324]